MALRMKGTVNVAASTKRAAVPALPVAARRTAVKTLAQSRTNVKTAVKQSVKQAQKAAQNNKYGRDALKTAKFVAEGDGEGNGVAYAALSLGFAATAVAIAAVPDLFAKLIFVGGYSTSHDYLHEPLFRLLAIGLAAASVGNWVQKRAADEDVLDEDVHRRLNGGISFFAAAQVFIQLLAFTPLAAIYLSGDSGSQIINPLAAAGFGVIAAGQWWVAGRNYARFSPEGASPVAILQSYFKDASNTFSDLNGPISGAYALLTTAFLGAGFSYLLLPYQTLDLVFGPGVNPGPEDVLLWQFVGAGVATLLGPITWSLREAAIEEDLSNPTYKLLNAGLFTASASHLVVLGPLLASGNAGPALPILLATWGAGAAVSAVNLLQRPEAKGAGRL